MQPGKGEYLDRFIFYSRLKQSPNLIAYTQLIVSINKDKMHNKTTQPGLKDLVAFNNKQKNNNLVSYCPQNII